MAAPESGIGGEKPEKYDDEFNAETEMNGKEVEVLTGRYLWGLPKLTKEDLKQSSFGVLNEQVFQISGSKALTNRAKMCVALFWSLEAWELGAPGLLQRIVSNILKQKTTPEEAAKVLWKHSWSLGGMQLHRCEPYQRTLILTPNFSLYEPHPNLTLSLHVVPKDAKKGAKAHASGARNNAPGDIQEAFYYATYNYKGVTMTGNILCLT